MVVVLKYRLYFGEGKNENVIEGEVCWGVVVGLIIMLIVCLFNYVYI